MKKCFLSFLLVYILFIAASVQAKGMAAGDMIKTERDDSSAYLQTEGQSVRHIGQYGFCKETDSSDTPEDAFQEGYDPTLPPYAAQVWQDVTYVLNTNSGKFHRLDCRWVASIHEENRLDCSCDYETLINAGFVPCKTCKPR